MRHATPSGLSGSRSIFGICVVISFLMTAACSASAETEPQTEDVRFHFTNAGPCKLVVNFAGGVASPTAGIDFTPAIGARNDVPIYGPGSVSIQISSAPAGVFECGFKLGFSSGALYVLKDAFLPEGYCGGDGWIVTSPAPGRLTAYSGQIVKSEINHC
jgi:hypothetical protein